jgi:Tetratricopeptide repeat
MNNLAGTLFAQGDFAGAREFEESVLETSRRVLGDEHPDTILARANLDAIRRQGE